MTMDIVRDIAPHGGADLAPRSGTDLALRGTDHDRGPRIGGQTDDDRELAQRVRALRRARRDARDRAARVRRALLAPTPAEEIYVPRPARHRTTTPGR